MRSAMGKAWKWENILSRSTPLKFRCNYCISIVDFVATSVFLTFWEYVWTRMKTIGMNVSQMSGSFSYRRHLCIRFLKWSYKLDWKSIWVFSGRYSSLQLFIVAVIPQWKLGWEQMHWNLQWRYQAEYGREKVQLRWINEICSGQAWNYVLLWR